MTFSLTSLLIALLGRAVAAAALLLYSSTELVKSCGKDTKETVGGRHKKKKRVKSYMCMGVRAAGRHPGITHTEPVWNVTAH